MDSSFELLGAYFVRVAPALLLGAVMLLLFHRQQRLRIVLYVTMFVLLRDAMTPLGLWSFGRRGFFWIRLGSNPTVLILSGLLCLTMSVGLYWLDQPNRALIGWVRGSPVAGILGGVIGAALVVAPFLVFYRQVPIDERGGPVAMQLLPALFFFALTGNLFEETLFRGYVYGLLAEQLTPARAGIACGVVFAFCHIFLAITVTNVGYTLLMFTLWEGIIAGLVGARWGVVSSTLTHGVAIFLLASGLL